MNFSSSKGKVAVKKMVVLFTVPCMVLLLIKTFVFTSFLC